VSGKFIIDIFVHKTTTSVGHTIEKCYRIHGFPLGFQFTQTKPINISFANQVPATESSSMPFTQAQCQQLLAFMQNNHVFSNAPSTLQAGSVYYRKLGIEFFCR